MQLTQQGLSEEEAGELLEKAFGWRGQVLGLPSVLCLHKGAVRQNTMDGLRPGVVITANMLVQAYWRKSRVKEVPAAEQLDAVLGFLAEQGAHGLGSQSGSGSRSGYRLEIMSSFMNPAVTCSAI